MRRLFLAIISLLFVTLIARAGELDNLLAKSSGTVLYFYTPTCSYCQKFEPNYKKLSKKYGNQYQFVKMNINSEDGYKLISELGIHYVPYVMVFNAKKQTVIPIEPDCMVSYSCSENIIKNNLIKKRSL